MSRLMSVSLTEQAVIERRKTVTRRLGWKMLKPGDRLTLCRKVMGRKKGEPLVRLAEVEVVSARRERLDAITPEDVQREGVDVDLGLRRGPCHAHPDCWISWFCQTVNVTPEAEITRIEWRYLP